MCTPLESSRNLRFSVSTSFAVVNGLRGFLPIVIRVIEFDAAFITIVCFLVCCDCLFRNERTLVLRSPHERMSSRYSWYYVYVSVYRIRNLERVCVSESESECVKVRQRFNLMGNKTTSSLIIHRLVEKNRRDDAKDKTADITDARRTPPRECGQNDHPQSHQIAQEERARESYLSVITAERSRIHSLRVAALMMMFFLCFVVALLFSPPKPQKLF